VSVSVYKTWGFLAEVCQRSNHIIYEL